MIRIGWEQTNVSAPSMESYQTANIDVDMTPISEKNASAPVDGQLLFKRVVNLLSFEVILLNLQNFSLCIQKA